MIKIIAGGKKNASWLKEITEEYEKRLRKPFDIVWEFVDEDKFENKLAKWPFDDEYVICCDERGENISSGEFSALISKAFINSRNVVILIGGAYGFSESVRERSDFVWSFSRLVFPHMIARLIVAEQVYRASEIYKGSHYHHE